MLLNKVAPMPLRPLKPEPINRMARLDAGIPRSIKAKRPLNAKQLAECRRLVDVLLECEIEPMLSDCDEAERPVASEWLTQLRFTEASKIALPLVLPRVRKYMTKWNAVIWSAMYDAYAHVMVVLIAQDLQNWEYTMHHEAPASEYKDTRYMTDVTERDDEDENQDWKEVY